MLPAGEVARADQADTEGCFRGSRSGDLDLRVALVGSVQRRRVAKHDSEAPRFAIENRVVSFGRVVEEIFVCDERLQLDSARTGQAQGPPQRAAPGPAPR